MKNYLTRYLRLWLAFVALFCPFISFGQNTAASTPQEYQKYLGVWQGDLDIDEKSANPESRFSFILKVYAVQYEDVSFTVIKSKNGQYLDSLYFKSSGAANEVALGLILPGRFVGETVPETVLQLYYRNRDGLETLRASLGTLKSEKETLLTLNKIGPLQAYSTVNPPSKYPSNRRDVSSNVDTGYTKAPEKSPLDKELDKIFSSFKSLTYDDRLAIFKHLKISPDHISLESAQIFYNSVQALRTDFNNDGIQEILVVMKGLNAPGVKSIFFAKPSLSSRYAPILSTTSPQAPVILLERSLGYNDLYVEEKGVGKVLRWNGSKYSLHKVIDKSIISKGRNTMEFEEANNHYYNKEYFPDLNSTDILSTIKELKDLRVKNVNAKKGSPLKFIGGWWIMGYYKYPIYIKRSGSKFAVSGNKFINARIFYYNLKNDRLEGWLEEPGIKVKFIIEYNYDYDTILIKPESKEAGMSPISLMRYK